MTELEFSRGDIEDLAQKLDSFRSQLSEREQKLLLAIFWAASDKVRHSPADEPDTTEVTITDLREQLLNAFIPDHGTEFMMRVPDIEPDR
jgi:hypothetical protein